MKFLGPLGMVATISAMLLGMLLMEEWTRNALFKGLCFCAMSYLLAKSYKKIKFWGRRARLQMKRWL